MAADKFSFREKKTISRSVYNMLENLIPCPKIHEKYFKNDCDEKPPIVGKEENTRDGTMAIGTTARILIAVIEVCV